jgi:uncharacterized membrane protein
MRVIVPLLAATALFTACEEVPDTSIQDSPSIVTENERQQAEEAPVFRAVGQEPGWILRIFRDIVTYEADYGERTITVNTPAVEEFEGGRRYETEALIVEIRDESCNDAMSGAPYPATVTVTESGRPPLQGCGGPQDYRGQVPE